MTISGIQLRCGPEGMAGMTVTLGGTIAAGYLSKIGDTVGVYFSGGDSGDLDSFIYRAKKILLPKNHATADTIAQGAKVYYNPSTHAVTNEASGNTLCGRCLEAAAGLATTVLVDLLGDAAA